MVRSEYIVYLNDDMYVLPKWDVELNNEIEQLSTKSFMLSSTMIAPVDIKNNCDIVKSYGHSIQEFDEALLLKEYEGLAVENWSGSSWPPNVVHVDMWDLVGGLSIEFNPGMYSDPDLSKKLYEVGVRIFKGVGKSLVYHFTQKSTKKIKQSNGRQLFLKKWGITANVFYNKILNIGEPYTINSGESISSWDLFIGKLKIFLVLFKSSK